MPSLDEPSFFWGDVSLEWAEFIMDCGSDGVAHVYAKTADIDEASMKADLLETREEWRRNPTAWVSAVGGAGEQYNERPNAHRWWPRDRRT